MYGKVAQTSYSDLSGLSTATHSIRIGVYSRHCRFFAVDGLERRWSQKTKYKNSRHYHYQVTEHKLSL